jgi:hypothetical protein
MVRMIVVGEQLRAPRIPSHGTIILAEKIPLDSG